MHRIFPTWILRFEATPPLKEKLTKARFAIEESQIPYKVDLIELSFAPYLEKIIKEEGILWHS